MTKAIEIGRHAASGPDFIISRFRIRLDPAPNGLPLVPRNEDEGEGIGGEPGVTNLTKGDCVAHPGPAGS